VRMRSRGEDETDRERDTDKEEDREGEQRSSITVVSVQRSGDGRNQRKSESGVVETIHVGTLETCTPTRNAVVLLHRDLDSNSELDCEHALRT